MPPDQDPTHETTPYSALPGTGGPSPATGSGAKSWVVGGVVLLLLAALFAFRNYESRPLARAFIPNPTPTPAPAVEPNLEIPSRVSAQASPPSQSGSMQVVPMSGAAPAGATEPGGSGGLERTASLAGSRREVIGYVPVLYITAMGSEDKPSVGWVSVKIDGVEAPDFPKKTYPGLQSFVPLPDRMNFKVSVVQRAPDGTFLQEDQFDFAGREIDQFSWHLAAPHDACAPRAGSREWTCARIAVRREDYGHEINVRMHPDLVRR